ncbi:hypothetical protein BDW22DRAFT_1429523 [Trametopsis cervina]|nr:hypothetical protein BDW22DRAFT_1429523 [Trametopsis cervina]
MPAAPDRQRTGKAAQAAVVTTKSGRTRHPTVKQAANDEEEVRRSQKRVQLPPVPRTIQAAARKISAATAGSITSHRTMTARDHPTPYASQREARPVTAAAPNSQRRISGNATYEVQEYDTFRSPLDDGGAEDLIDDDSNGDGRWISEDDGTGMPPNSEPTSEDQDDHNEEFIPSRSNHHSRSPSPDPEPFGNIQPLRRLVRRHADQQAERVLIHNPVSSHKRALSGPTDSTTIAQPIKIQKVLRYEGRARRSDYENDVQDLIKATQGLMKVRLYTMNAFPSASQQEEWIADTWTEANTRECVDYQISSDIHRLLLRCGTQLHSAVKGAARDVVSATYQFSPSVSKKDKDRNRRLYEILMDEDPESPPGWLFKRSEIPLPASERRGIYQNPSLSSFTNKTIYNTRSRSAIGIKYPELIGESLTLAHIAFNLTMIQFALMEWEDGLFHDTTFTEDVGRKLYEAHCADLARYKQVFGGQKLHQLGERLVADGRDFAGLGPYMTASRNTGRIALSAFERLHLEKSSTLYRSI